VRRAAQTSADRRLRINVSVATFVPKPHTPFQWEPQISIDEAFARIDLLKKSLPRGNYKLKWHDPRQSFLEGVMSRGDRQLSRVIEEAWQRGARLDAWTEHFDLNVWLEAAEACNIDLSPYLRQREFSETLPWQHLDTGVDEEFLRAELAKSLTGEYTPDCRVHGCQKCGACDFKEVRPVVQCKSKGPDESGDEKIIDVDSDKSGEKVAARGPAEDKKTAANKPHHWYRLFYAKQGDIRFLSHLEMIQVFFQAFRRANLQVHFSQGFNPVPKVSFSPALPVGTESLAEYMDVDLKQPVADQEFIISSLNRQLPEGCEIVKVALSRDCKTNASAEMLTCYRIRLSRSLSQEDQDRLQGFLDKESITVSKVRKGKTRLFDIRKQVAELHILQNNKIELIQISHQDKASSKPMEIIKEVFKLTEDEVLDVRIVKLWSTQAK
jgi:radical SAM-linked protein